jgi:hypothetical protein
MRGEMSIHTLGTCSREIHGRRRAIELGLVAAFCVLGLAGILHHEMWRDELQAWLIARDSATLAELFRNVRYENHPALWHLLLYLITRFTPNPLAMQLLHLLIATVSVYMVIRYAPFSTFQKVMFCLGYFPLFEYCVISRCYALGVALLLLFCVLYTRRRGLIPISMTLFLLCQTSAVGIVVAMAITIFLVMDGRLRPSSAEGRGGLMAAIVILWFGFIIAMVQLKSPGVDRDVLRMFARRNQPDRFQQSLATLWRAHVPLPPPGIDFWEWNIVRSLRIQYLLAIPLVAAIAFTFLGRPSLFVLYLTATAGLVAFFQFVHLGNLRHHGYMFMMTVVCLWLNNDPARRWAPRWGSGPRWANALLTVLLIIHAVGGMSAYARDLGYPFSVSSAVARYIKSHKLDKMEMIGYEDFFVSPVTAYIDRPMYYAEAGRSGTFIVWDYKNRKVVRERGLLREAQEMAERGKGDVLIVANYRILDDAIATGRWRHPVRKIAEFPRGIVPYEEYSLYIVQYVRVSQTPQGVKSSGMPRIPPAG